MPLPSIIAYVKSNIALNYAIVEERGNWHGIEFSIRQIWKPVWQHFTGVGAFGCRAKI